MPFRPQQHYPAFFALVAEEGFFNLTLPRIAAALGLKLGVLLAQFPDKESLLVGFSHYLDQHIADYHADAGAPLKDRLFELLMQRFDAMQPCRHGLVSVIETMRQHPLQALCLTTRLAPIFHQAFARMVEMAGVAISRPQAQGFVWLLQAACVPVLWAWKNDNHADLSSTMAALSRALDRVARFERFV